MQRLLRLQIRKGEQVRSVLGSLLQLPAFRKCGRRNGGTNNHLCCRRCSRQSGRKPPCNWSSAQNQKFHQANRSPASSSFSDVQSESDLASDLLSIGFDLLDGSALPNLAISLRSIVTPRTKKCRRFKT